MVVLLGNFSASMPVKALELGTEERGIYSLECAILWLYMCAYIEWRKYE